MHSRDFMLSWKKTVPRNYYYCVQDDNSLCLCFKNMYWTLFVAIFTSSFIFSMSKSSHTYRNINISNHHHDHHHHCDNHPAWCSWTNGHTIILIIHLWWTSPTYFSLFYHAFLFSTCIRRQNDPIYWFQHLKHKICPEAQKPQLYMLHDSQSLILWMWMKNSKKSRPHDSSYVMLICAEISSHLTLDCRLKQLPLLLCCCIFLSSG